MAKMDWFVENYINNTLTYDIHNTGKSKGTIVIPTGGGKSGLVYADIIKHIEKADVNKKYIFNISAPILKLEAQLINDFFAVLNQIFPNKYENNEFMFFVNSSANGEAYDADIVNMDVSRFVDIDKFINSKNAKFAIVASCHKSLYKFAEKIDYLKKHSIICSYLDESHLVVSESKSDINFSKLSKESKRRFNVLTEICKSDYLYALSATPDKYITDEINKNANEKNTSMYLIEISARELIAANIILPVFAWYRRVGNGDNEKITPDICLNFMQKVISQNDKIKHKILVTCSSVNHLNSLREALSSHYKVFSTCSRDGGMSANNNEENVIDEASFIKEVDEWNDNCFVLHIRQLIQGIDIKSLTGCIIYNSAHVGDDIKRFIIQTIGRILRPYEGERGFSKEKRTKQHGDVLFLIGDNEFDKVHNQIVDFLLHYYGRDGIKSFTKDINHDYGNIGKNKILFGSGLSGFGDDYIDYYDELINKLLIDMEAYINERILPKYKNDLILSGGKYNKNLVPSYIAEIKKKFANYSGLHDTSDLLSDTEFMKNVSDLFVKYNIE